MWVAFRRAQLHSHNSSMVSIGYPRVFDYRPLATLAGSLTPFTVPWKSKRPFGECTIEQWIPHDSCSGIIVRILGIFASNTMAHLISLRLVSPPIIEVPLAPVDLCLSELHRWPLILVFPIETLRGWSHENLGEIFQKRTMKQSPQMSAHPRGSHRASAYFPKRLQIAH